MPTYKASAMMLAVVPTDGGSTDGGSGGSSGGTCIGFDCWGATQTSFSEVQLATNDTRANVPFIFSLNLDKETYSVDESVKALAYVQYQGCNNTAWAVVIEGQVLPIYNHYTIMNQYVHGGYGIYGERTFTPPFEAPEKPGNYAMNIKIYDWNASISGGFGGSRTDNPTPNASVDLPYTVVADCNIAPAGYTKCSDENGTCTFPGTAYVMYGCQKTDWMVGQNATDSIACNSTSFGSDPLPGIVKACYVGSGSLATTPTTPTTPTTALSVQVFANGKSAETVAYNGTARITWSTSLNATACTCSYSPIPPGETGYCGSGIGQNVLGSVPANLKASTVFNVSCTDVPITTTPPPTDPIITSTGKSVCPSYYPSCFIADTVVQMADGTTKNIEDVKIGDVLKGEKTNNKVLGFHQPKLNEKKLYSFNGGRYFVTAEHPFKTITGWKSINPSLTAQENIGITVTELKVGDTLITETGKVLLKTIDSKGGEANTQLYNFILDGDHTYYADGYLVHNKMACTAGQVPNLAGGCEAPCAFSCPSGYTKSCNGGSTLCTQDSCGGTTTYNCTGTVAGSSPQTYEGESCNQFTTQATCQQGWLTHGCSWNGTVAATGVCNAKFTNDTICYTIKKQTICNANSTCFWTDSAAQ